MCALVLQNLLWSWALLEIQVLVVALATGAGLPQAHFSLCWSCQAFPLLFGVIPSGC